MLMHPFQEFNPFPVRTILLLGTQQTHLSTRESLLSRKHSGIFLICPCICCANKPTRRQTRKIMPLFIPIMKPSESLIVCLASRKWVTHHSLTRSLARRIINHRRWVSRTFEIYSRSPRFAYNLSVKGETRHGGHLQSRENAGDGLKPSNSEYQSPPAI